MNEFNEWEKLLRQELQLRKAPADFSERVMARLPGPSRTNARETKYRRWWLAPHRVAAAVFLSLLVGRGYWKHAHEEQIAGERARSQLITALRITASTLHDVRHKLGEKHRGEIR